MFDGSIDFDAFRRGSDAAVSADAQAAYRAHRARMHACDMLIILAIKRARLREAMHRTPPAPDDPPYVRQAKAALFSRRWSDARRICLAMRRNRAALAQAEQAVNLMLLRGIR